jgi:steroid delta-isomerase-like uncharacterized protein
MTRDAVVVLLERREAGMAARDVEMLQSTYADTAALESPLAGSVVGRDAVTRVYASFFQAFPDATISSEPPLIDGDSAALVSTISGTHHGDFLGLAPTGKAFRFRMVALLTFRDGLIVAEQRIYDFTGLLIQLGVLKAKPA